MILKFVSIEKTSERYYIYGNRLLQYFF